MDTNSGTVTEQIEALKRGDEAAVQPLWERYFKRLVCLVRERLRATGRRPIVADEEDVALSAIELVCEGIEHGRFPQLSNRDDLWRLLVWVAGRKVLDQRKREGRVKRGGGKVVTEADLAAEDDAARPLDELDPSAVIYQTARGEPTPEFAAVVAEEYGRRLDELADPELRRIAELKLGCFTDQEVAEAIGRSLRATTLRLEKIRRLWTAAG